MITIIPDIHGLPFWKDAVAHTGKDDVSVFLGDYLDPYWSGMVFDGVSHESTIDNFRQIISLKKSRPGNVILLLGNHDCEYLYGRNVCDCRCDDVNYDRIRSLFRDNAELFRIAWETTMRRTHYIFSHAGLSPHWLNRHVKGWTPDNVVTKLNRMNARALLKEKPEDTRFASALSVCDRYRGGEKDYGSPVWMDAETAATQDRIKNVVQIVGHTHLRYYRPVYSNGCWFLDCDSHWFTLNEYGTIRNESGKKCVNCCDPFNPPGMGIIDTDCFNRLFCRKCGSRNINVRAGIMASVLTCRNCGIKEVQ